ncbi:MAG: PAS domain S-box protein [Pseudomonadota bacterium]
MIEKIKKMQRSFLSRIIAATGLTLFVSISIWAFFIIRYQHEKTTEAVITSVDRLATTIRLSTRQAMMLNSRDDINQIIRDVSQLEDLSIIRIYNKKGVIKFSSNPAELNRETDIRAEACDVCHKAEPPSPFLEKQRRIRFLRSGEAFRLAGIITPIYNEPGCSTADCHFHPADKPILGALDVVISPKKADDALRAFRWEIVVMMLLAFFTTAITLFFLVSKFIRQPIRKLILGTERLTAGHYDARVDLQQNDELGQLADAINVMGKTIGDKELALNKQRDDYQRLFEMVPCLITVQDKAYKLISYNRQFAEKFNPKPGDYCYCAYKGRSEKCDSCPVEKTFQDGLPHFSQETAFRKDGTARHWIVRTSPIKNAEGEIIAAMEMSLDITHRKSLQTALEESEKKYYAIFNNMPNPIFVLTADTLEIIDCNDIAVHVYGYDKSEMTGKHFPSFFGESERPELERKIMEACFIDKVLQEDKDGNSRVLNIRISPFDYPGRKALLVTTSDITQWLDTEQQLIQASKMATLGEMATGVAHELNQPLSVIKTAGSYFIKKVRNKEPIPPDIMEIMAEEIDSHVDRASKIINHMRQFGRKSVGEMENVQLNDILRRAFEIFSQQLKLREITVVWELAENLPYISGDPGRLEQVFINLLMNARDAIEEKCEGIDCTPAAKKIILRSRLIGSTVRMEIQDTGGGIKATIIDRVFEPFFTTKKVGKGTGLGLSISYGIVKDCGGEIHVVPTTDGACFRLTFPAMVPSGNGDAG